MRVAVLEYLCGGGLLDESAASSLIHEGIAMLSGLANDFALCGHSVHTLLDLNGAPFKKRFHSNVRLNSLDSNVVDRKWMDHWIDIAKACDLAIVIAPELDNQLTRIVEQLRLSGAKVLAPSVPFLQATSDKLTTAKLLSQFNITHPKTQTLTKFQATDRCIAQLEILEEEIPLTLKRRDGAGCEDMMIFANLERLEYWLSIHSSYYVVGDDWLVQEWLPGRAASMAIIAGKEWQVIGAVEQTIQSETANQDGWSSVSYLGGRGPLQDVTDEILVQLAKAVQQALPAEAAGWLGIDFLVPNDPTQLRDYVVVEINPRLTTSYLGYRKWYGPQLAGALLKTPGNPGFFSGVQKIPMEFSVCEFTKNHGET